MLWLNRNNFAQDEAVHAINMTPLAFHSDKTVIDRFDKFWASLNSWTEPPNETQKMETMRCYNELVKAMGQVAGYDNIKTDMLYVPKGLVEKSDLQYRIAVNLDQYLVKRNELFDTVKSTGSNSDDCH